MAKRKIPHHELTMLMKQADASDVFRSFMDWLTDMDELQKSHGRRSRQKIRRSRIMFTNWSLKGTTKSGP